MVYKENVLVYTDSKGDGNMDNFKNVVKELDVYFGKYDRYLHELADTEDKLSDYLDNMRKDGEWMDFNDKMRRLVQQAEGSFIGVNWKQFSAMTYLVCMRIKADAILKLGCLREESSTDDICINYGWVEMCGVALEVGTPVSHLAKSCVDYGIIRGQDAGK